MFAGHDEYQLGLPVELRTNNMACGVERVALRVAPSKTGETARRRRHHAGGRGPLTENEPPA